MRVSPVLLGITATAALLSACGKQSAAPAQVGAPAPAVAEAPTPEQMKATQATLPAPYNAADLENGKHKFAQCAACHTLAQGAPNMTGPNLWGVFGRKAGTAANYDYSDAVKAAGFTWDAAHIDTWITDPRAMIPGTKMTFIGLKDPKDRADVIAYVKVNTTAAK
ncbi:MAG TPA: cytochrome c family protein [Caulobacteraceae bacterium]|jgi:cytochrome c